MHRVAIATLSLLFASSATALPTADELLAETGFSADEKRRIKRGEFVTGTVQETSERELAVDMAFLVRQPVPAVVAKVRGGVGLEANPGIEAFGEIRGPGDLTAFEEVTLDEDAVQDFLRASPGNDLNLDTAEIEAFRALREGADASRAKAVERQLRKVLLARYQAYRDGGLDAVAPYDRGKGKKTSPGAELRKASEAAALMQKYAPSFYTTLVGYPKGKAPLEQSFYWVRYDVDGESVYVLSHRFRRADGDNFLIAERQFYVTGSYNAEQALALLTPVEEGTLVLYLNRTSTDQVAGFGSGGKHAIGRKMLAADLKKAFEAIRAEVQQTAR